MNITLIGMPGAGKSTIGHVLANRLGYAFLDIDRVLEETHGKPLQQILDEAGDEGFIRLEEAAVLGQREIKDTVIATGGSMVYSPVAMARLKRISTVVFLNVSLRDLQKRLRLAGRGVVRGRDLSLEEIFEQRLPLYKRYADISLMLESTNTETNAALILQALKVQ